MTGAATQRRLLGLLAVLAASGDAGLSRDRVVSILWPDVELEKARHSLTQALYQTRRALSCDDLFCGGSDLRLNPERISSDIRELDAALRAGNLADAVSRYHAEFLADFFLPANAEFDRWADGQRRRVAQQIERALEQLASEAVRSGEHLRAVDYRRRLAMLDPLNSRAAFLFIESLRDAGDPAGARRHLDSHQTLVRTELDSDLAPEFDALRESLRRPSLPSEIARPEPVVSAAPAGALVETPQLAKARSPSFRTWALAAALLVTVGAVGSTFIRGAAERLTAPRFDQQLLVAPFRTAGADPSLRFLREGLVELISLRIGSDSGASATDPGAVLRAWRSERPDSTGLDASTAVRLAERFGARAIVTGSVVGGPQHLVISATIVDIADSGRRVDASVEGPLDSLTSLVDEISGRMLIASAGETERFRRAVTPSPSALRAFLGGLAAYRRGRYLTATRAFEIAIRRDTTFALGAMYLALAADKVNASFQHSRALSLALTYQSQLAEGDRLLLTAFAGPRYPAASTSSEQLAAWEAAVAWSPGRTDALIEYAERLDRSGRLLGATDPTGRAGSLLRQVLRVDPHNRHAQALLMSIVVRGAGAELQQLDTMPALPAWAVWAIATMRGDSETVRRIRGEMQDLQDGDLTRIARMGQFTATGIGDVERALNIKRERARDWTEQLDAILAQHSLAINQGRPARALQLTSELEALQPGNRAYLRLRVLDALYGGGDSTAAAAAAVRLARYVDGPEPSAPSARSLRRADACVLAQWRLEMGNTAAVRKTIADLRSAGLPRGRTPIGAAPRACAELLDAAVAVVTKAPTAARKLAVVDSLALGGPAAADVGAYAHLLIARLYERLGQPKLALAALRRRSTIDGWSRYLATARRDEGRLAFLTGDRAGGLTVYRKYLALRVIPEAPVAAEVARVRAAVNGGPAGAQSRPTPRTIPRKTRSRPQ